MKRLALVFLILCLTLPAMADVIIFGVANSAMGGGYTYTSLPNLFPVLGNNPYSNTNAWIELTSGDYSASANTFKECAELSPGQPGVAMIQWESYLYGNVNSEGRQLTFYTVGSELYVSGNWTVEDGVGGLFVYFDGQKALQPIFFSGPATYSFTLSGPVSAPTLDFFLDFSASAPSPIPEPATLLLMASALVPMCRAGIKKYI